MCTTCQLEQTASAMEIGGHCIFMPERNKDLGKCEHVDNKNICCFKFAIDLIWKIKIMHVLYVAGRHTDVDQELKG